MIEPDAIRLKRSKTYSLTKHSFARVKCIRVHRSRQFGKFSSSMIQKEYGIPISCDGYQWEKASHQYFPYYEG